MIALLAADAADLAGALVPGLIVAGVGGALFALGWRLARRVPPSGLAEIERALHDLAAGDMSAHASVTPGDPAYGSATLIDDIVRHLSQRQGRPERRAYLLSEAVEGLGNHAMLVLDRDLSIVLATPRTATLGAGDPASLEGRPLAELLTPEAFKELAGVVAQHRRRRTPFRVELELAPSLAHAVPLPVHGTFINGGNDVVALLIETEPELAAGGEPPRVALERYWAILSGLPEGVLVVADGKIVEINAQAETWLGEGLQGAALKDLVAAEDLLLVLDRVARAASGELVDPVPCRLLPRSATLRPREIELFAAPVRCGKRRAAAVVLRDLGAERRADRRARINEARLISVLDAVGDALLMLTPPAVEGSPWRVGLINRQMLELLDLDGSMVRGAPEEEFRSLVAHRFGEPAQFAGLMENAARDPMNEHAATLELAAVQNLTLELLLRPVIGVDGELLGRMLVVRDITRHRDVERQLVADAAALGRSRETLQRAYEQLAAVNEALEHKTGELDGLNRELVELDRARAQLLGDVTHELQTPLVSIRGYCQMILEGRLGKINDEQRRGLEVALRNVDRMVELINNLLSLSRAERGAPLQAEPIDPTRVLAEVIERHQEAARNKSVRLEVQVDDPSARVLAEREGLTQVFDNLVGNAIKFNRAGGRVVVTVESGPAGFVRLDVADTGIGIPAEETARVFERFYRGRGASGTPGSGIGLATVRNIVQRHGGSIELQSVPGEGSSFRINWPRASAAGLSSGTPAAAASG